MYTAIVQNYVIIHTFDLISRYQSQLVPTLVRVGFVTAVLLSCCVLASIQPVPPSSPLSCGRTCVYMFAISLASSGQLIYTPLLVSLLPTHTHTLLTVCSDGFSSFASQVQLW